MMDEAVAKRILATALLEDRAAELLDCLFEGGSVTVDASGRLVLISSDTLAQFFAPGEPHA